MAVGFFGGEKLKQISLVIVGEDKIREINKKYRGKDAVTDVLSFEELNEIFICLAQAQRQADLLKTSLNFELTRLLVHGIVHLKGYDHERSKKEADEMEGIERKIVKDLKL
ncbi:MAG: putative rRNA maturation factor [Parcubacteria group bacterium GW2011_GWB1_42_6]|nr:MAG: putative rRNA maturation factor [Parcubacteria group bacterium GW2011_GWB1_42_6]